MFKEIQDWMAQRCGKFTASEIYKLMGSGKKDYFSLVAKTYISQKAAEILTLEPSNRPNTMAMDWGQSHEYEAYTKFKEMYGDCEYFGGENPTFFKYSKYSGGSPDALGSDFVLEIKCPYNSSEHLNHWLYETGEDLKDGKPEYYWQVVANMIFTGKDKAIFVSYDPRFEPEYQLKTLKISLNLDDACLLQERLREAEIHLDQLLNKINAKGSYFTKGSKGI